MGANLRRLLYLHTYYLAFVVHALNQNPPGTGGIPFIKVRDAAGAAASLWVCASNHSGQYIAVIPLLTESTFSSQHLFPLAQSP